MLWVQTEREEMAGSSHFLYHSPAAPEGVLSELTPKSAPRNTPSSFPISFDDLLLPQLAFPLSLLPFPHPP